MSINSKINFKELSREESLEYLEQFESMECCISFGMMDWYDSDRAQNYIWLLDTNDNKPLGFIGYNILTLKNGEEFLYIVKFYVLNEYRKYNNSGEVKLIEEEKASSILFKRILSKKKNIITLTAANGKLEKYYIEEYGFTFNEEICEKLAYEAGESIEGFLYLELTQDQRSLDKKDNLQSLFG